MTGPATTRGGPPKTQDGNPAATPWYKRRAVLGAAAIVIVVAIAVITDLPAPTSPAIDAKAESSIIGQINTDVGPCVYAVDQALSLYSERARLDASQQSQVPGLLRDDENACSLADSSIYDLSDIDVMGTSAGKHISDAVSVSTTWATSDALGVIDLIEILEDQPRDRRAATQLVADREQMAKDRDVVDSQVVDAERLDHRQLPAVKLSSGATPKGPVTS